MLMSAPSQVGYPYGSEKGWIYDPSRTYTLWSILNIFIGSLILGLVALFYSRKVSGFNKLQDAVEAERASRRALAWNIFATIVGLLQLIAVAIALGVVFG